MTPPKKRPPPQKKVKAVTTKGKRRRKSKTKPVQARRAKISKRSERSRRAKVAKAKAVDFDQFVQSAEKAKRDYILHLYVSGNSERSRQAMKTIRDICEEFVPGHYSLKIVDIFQQPEQAVSAQIVASPTLVKTFPKPGKVVVGNLVDRARIIQTLELR